MTSNKDLKESLQLSDILFACSGILFLVSVLVIFQAHNFTFWYFAKAFYAVALIIFVRYS